MTNVELWVNPNPNSAFASQTISLDLTNYKYVVIVFQSSYNDNIRYTQKVIKGNRSTLFAVSINDSAGITCISREVEIKNNGIIFNVGIYGRINPSAQYNKGAQNNFVIPIAIYGTNN